MLAAFIDVVWDDPAANAIGKSERWLGGDVLLVEDHFGHGSLDDALVQRILSCRQRLVDTRTVLGRSLVGCLAFEIIESKCLDLSYFGRLKDVHRHSIGTMVGQVAAYPYAQLLFSLPDIERFTVIVIEHIDTTLCIARVSPRVISRIEETFYLTPNGRYFFWYCRDIAG